MFHAKVVWMHCASLGEFEMGKPILEGFLNRNPHWSGVVTFFSPSGYEPRKNYERALMLKNALLLNELEILLVGMKIEMFGITI